MERQRKPPLTKELIKFLDESFPDKLPRNKEMTATDLAFLQGQRMVVDYLIQLFEQED
jgi:hypothetical protein